MHPAVGFYWTLPVPHVGFTDLPKEVEAAARRSQTIRYQRDLVRRWCRAEKYELVHEEAFLELRPDGGTQNVREPLSRLERICLDTGAVLLIVDFAALRGRRSHAAMTDWAEGARVEMLKIAPDRIPAGNGDFDPAAHFAGWQAEQRSWSAGREGRRELATAEIAMFRAQGLRHAEIAAALEAGGVRSLGGKPWTGEMVRKLATTV